MHYSSWGPLLVVAFVGLLIWLFTMGVFTVILMLPARLVNSLAGRNVHDDFGGKVIALSFLLGPVCAGGLMLFLDRREILVALIGGWILGIAIGMRVLR